MMDKRVALITGAGSGIGKATALAFLRDGFRVVLAGRHVEKLEAVGGAGAATRRRWSSRPMSREPESVRALFDATQEKFGRLDVLFNNAGMNAPFLPLEDMPYEKWREVIDTNLTGAFLCTQQAFRLMKDQSRAADASSTTARSPRTRRARIPRPTRRRSTPSPGSRSPRRSMGASTTSPAGRSTSAMR